MQDAAKDSLRQCPKCQVVEEGSEQYCGDCGVPLGDEVLVSGRFRVRKKLGQGTFGSVWEAVDINLGEREVAIKLLRPVSEASQQFAGEIKALTRIKDRAHVVTVFDGGLLKPDNRPFIVMEKLDGQTLHAYRERSQKGRLPPAQALTIILQAAKGVAAAHRQEITHRDLSPSNLFVLHDERDGIPQIRVLDFGVALLKTESTGGAQLPVIGTPGFVAPEVLAGAAPSPTSDVYSLGAIWFLLLEGDQVPIAGLEDRIDLLDRRLRRTGSGLSAEMVLLLKDMLSPELSRRPADASALVQRLRRLPERSGKQARTGAGRRRTLRAAMILAVAALVAVWLWLWRRPVDPIQQALHLAHSALQAPADEQRKLAVVALQQCSDPQLTAALIPRLQDRSPDVVEASIEALEHLRGKAARMALRRMRDDSQNALLAARASLSIAHLGDTDGSTWLRQRLATTFPVDARVAAAMMLLQLEQPPDEALRIIEHAANKQASKPAQERVQSLPLLRLLAQRQDPWALAELQQLSQTSVATGFNLLALQHLAAVPDEKARASLHALASGAGENQLQAAVKLAALGDASMCPALIAGLLKGIGSEAHRGLLLDGLLHCSGKPILSLATALLQDRKLAIALRLRAAAIVLREELGRVNDSARLTLDANQTLSLYAMGATLGEDILADLDEANPEAGEVVELQAASPDTRERYLRHATWQLSELVRVLPATPTEAKPGVISAIARALTRLRSLGGSQEMHVGNEALRQLAKSPDRVTALSAQIAQYRLGDTRQEARIRSSLHDESPWIRRKSIEALRLPAAELLPHLVDVDPGVQLLVVRRLLALGRRAEVKDTLRALVQAGGGYGLLSLDLLRQVEPQAETLSDEQLLQLIGSGALPDRLAVVTLSAELPSERALPLLQRALHDPAAVIRRRIIEQCQRRYLSADRALRAALQHLIEALRDDRELIVRTWAEQALRVLTELPPPPPVVNPPDAGSPDAAPPARAAETGTLRLRRQPEVQLWLDGKALAGNLTSLTLPAGRHSLSYLTGEKSVSIPAGREILVDVPVQAIQQALYRAQTAMRNGQRKLVETAISDAEGYYQKYHPDDQISAEYLYGLGRWYMFSGQRPEAMSTFTRYLALASRGYLPERRAEVQTIVAALRRELAEVIIWRQLNGTCVESERKYYKPVKQILRIPGPEGQIFSLTVVLEAGKQIHVRTFCTK